MKKPLEKVQKLIAIAIHEGTPENEARNAAVAACRLIHEHGLLSEPTTSTRRRTVAVHPDAATVVDAWSDEVFSEVLRKHGFDVPKRTRPRGGGFADPFYQRPKRSAVDDFIEEARKHEAPEPPQHRVEGQETRQADPAAKNVVVGMQRLNCSKCGEVLPRGRLAVWSRGDFFHTHCWASFHFV